VFAIRRDRKLTITANSKMPQVLRSGAGGGLENDSTMFIPNCPVTIKGNPAKELI